MCLRVSYKKKICEIFFSTIKVTEERSQIRIRYSEVRIRGVRIRTNMSRIPNTA
jgi:hypothetical protein